MRKAMAWAGRACLISLAVLAAVLICCYLSEVYRCSRYQPTGDKLFDCYAREVIRRQAWRLFRSYGTHPATLPDSVLAAWEPQFGSEPRYWQLRYWSMLNRKELPTNFAISDTSSNSRETAVSFLDRAIKRGAANSDTYLMRLNEAGIQLSYRTEDDDKATAQQLVTSLTQKLLNTGSDWAYAHYKVALMAYKSGDLQRTLSELKAGNAANDSHIPLCFPVDFALTRLEEVPPVEHAFPGGNRVVYGAVISLDWYGDPLAFWQYRDAYGLLPRDLVSKYGLEAAAAVHECACRIGGTPVARLRQITFALALLRHTAYAVLAEPDIGFTMEQRKLVIVQLSRTTLLADDLAAYGAVATDQLKALELAGMTYTYKNWEYFPPSRFENFTTHFSYNLWFYNTPAAWQLHALLAESELREHKAYTWGEFENMSHLDYKALELPKDWWDIGAAAGMPEMHPEKHEELLHPQAK